MNIDRIKEIQEETICPESKSIQQALLQVWNECAQDEKPVDCNECALLESVTGKGHYQVIKQTSGCLYCTNNPAHKSNFKPRPKEWYEDGSNFPCLCWCNGLIKLIKSSYVFNGDRCFTSDTIIAFDDATPLTKEEVLKYCLGAE